MRYLASALLVLFVAACEPRIEQASRNSEEGASGVESHSAGGQLIPEAFVGDADPEWNLDSLAFWPGNAESPPLLIGTSKSLSKLLVFEPTNGELLRTVAEPGPGDGQLQRPNGIAVVSDLVLVVERDNRRVQVFSLPDFTPQATFGSDRLERPYGITVRTSKIAGADTLALDVFVTDNFDVSDSTPPEDMQRRIVQFRLDANGSTSSYVTAFGEAQGPGRLDKIETLFVDPERDVLLVAEELEGEQALQHFDTSGVYVGEAAGLDLFPHEPEGLALYPCNVEGMPGYWIATDQQDERTVFHLLERDSFEPVFSFQGQVVANTDGVASTSLSLPDFPLGMFWAVHDDQAVGGFDWRAILENAGIDLATCRSADL